MRQRCGSPLRAIIPMKRPRLRPASPPTQASPATLKVDLYGTALVLEEFGNVIADGGAGFVIASQSGHRLPPITDQRSGAVSGMHGRVGLGERLSLRLSFGCLDGR